MTARISFDSERSGAHRPPLQLARFDIFSRLLEINSRVQCDGPRSGGRGDPTETGGVDIGVRGVPYWPVQHIDRVGTDRERFSLAKASPLFQRHVEAEAAWPFEAGE